MSRKWRVAGFYVIFRSQLLMAWWKKPHYSLTFIFIKTTWVYLAAMKTDTLVTHLRHFWQSCRILGALALNQPPQNNQDWNLKGYNFRMFVFQIISKWEVVTVKYNRESHLYTFFLVLIFQRQLKMCKLGLIFLNDDSKPLVVEFMAPSKISKYIITTSGKALCFAVGQERHTNRPKQIQSYILLGEV